MSTSRNKKHFYAILSNEFMTQKYLDSIGMQSTRIFHDHVYLKLRIKKLLLCR